MMPMPIPMPMPMPIPMMPPPPSPEERKRTRREKELIVMIAGLVILCTIGAIAYVSVHTHVKNNDTDNPSDAPPDDPSKTRAEQTATIIGLVMAQRQDLGYLIYDSSTITPSQTGALLPFKDSDTFTVSGVTSFASASDSNYGDSIGQITAPCLNGTYTYKSRSFDDLTNTQMGKAPATIYGVSIVPPGQPANGYQVGKIGAIAFRAKQVENSGIGPNDDAAKNYYSDYNVNNFYGLFQKATATTDGKPLTITITPKEVADQKEKAKARQTNNSKMIIAGVVFIIVVIMVTIFLLRRKRLF